MESLAFRIEYDGPALREHTMDVRVLASSLLAFSDLCQETNRVLNGDRAAPVRMNISATSERCFGVVLEWVETAVREISFERIAEAVGILNAGKGLFSYMKRKGIEDKRRQQHDGEVRKQSLRIGQNVSGEDNALSSLPKTLTWTGYGDPAAVLALDLRVRMAHRQFLVPLELPGIDEIRLIREGETIANFRKAAVEEGQYDIRPQEFDQPNALIRPQMLEAVLQLRIPAFVRGRRWEFTYDGRRIYVTIKDADFLARVFEKKEQFRAQDYFRVQMQITQELRPNGKIRNVYEILRVLGVNPIISRL